MGVLKGFERRLEGAVEGMFARIFKSGLQPIELAQAIQRYATDHRHVTSVGVVVCNDYRISIHPDDVERLSGYGSSLARELANVVTETAADHGWRVPGDIRITTVSDADIDVGRFELVGRVHTPDTDPTAQPVATPRARQAAAPGPGATTNRPDATAAMPAPTAGDPGAPSAPPVADVRLEVVATGQVLDLVTGRYTIGRLATCDLPVDSTTVSREHAALLKRNDTWWVVDLGSTNGTRVNGVRASEHPVRPGDTLKVGTIEINARSI
ncbi:FhaA domain-containing protein [Salsipaludibacter albus]|uniref:FhaA domain-containing protein n=1 Tax=Salsipaludibacter albus TaxID=2849650 RepID=UPI001EE4C62A|nr:DUF3662 and FHA domain-containing protein [Salsipaludibacter albus]MBY5163987.1 DUF3662 domain-containing protein [Salsipaludibacter albus]